MTRWHIFAAAAALAACGIWWLLCGEKDPRQLALGEWQEASSRLRVEVQPGLATYRGMGHGKLRYEWLQADKKPYRLCFTYRGDTYETLLTFDGDNTAILDLQVWDKLDSAAKQQLRDQNRRRNRPEKELRLVFRRVVQGED